MNKNDKERIRVSNENVAKGLPADPWVLEYRRKNNIIKYNWKKRQPKKESKIITANSGSFKKGAIPHNIKSDEERAASLKKWREGTKKWHRDNRERVNASVRERKRISPSFRISCNLRKRISYLVRLHCTTKSKQTLVLLGCEMSFFLDYLKSNFKEGMSFDNYGQWHIDHIKPCDSFDLTMPDQQAQCFHYTNLQPLWGIDNRIKSNKI